MTSTNYDLELFDDLLGGALCPENVNLSSIPEIVTYLTNYCGACSRITHITVKKRKQIHSIEKVSELSNAHPLYTKYQIRQSSLFDWYQTGSLDKSMIDQLEIDLKKIKYVESVEKHSTKQLTIEYHSEWSDLPPDHLKYYYFSALLKKESESIRKRIQTNIFNLSDKQNAEFYIHKMQRYMSEASNDLLEAYNFNLDNLSYSIKDEYTDEDIYAMVYLHLEDLIVFIEKKYLNHLDRNVLVPLNSSLHTIYQLSEKVHLINNRLDLFDLPPELKHCIQYPLFKVCSRSLDDRMTYRELMYHNQFISKLHDLLINNNELEEERVIAFCFEVNFNCMKLIEYLTTRIKSQMNAVSTGDEVDQVLRRELKLVNQQQLHTRKFYNDRMQSLKAFMVNWIEQEILFHTQSKGSTLTVNSVSQTLQDLSKIDVSLSVPQLAFLFRLMCDTGLVNTQSKQELMRTVAKTFSTSKVNSISVKSLHNSFYEQDDQTIEAVKHALIEMLSTLKSGNY